MPKKFKVKEIIDYYLAGNSLPQTGEKFDVCRATVSSILKSAGVARRKTGGIPGLSPEQEHEALAYYLAGNSLNKTAKHFGGTRQIITSLLKRKAIKARTKSDGLRLISSQRSLKLRKLIDKDAEVVTHYLSGKSAHQVGDIFGVSHKVILRILEINGIERRNLREAISLAKYKDRSLTQINENIRKSTAYIEWRKEVFKRDNWTCMWCGVIGGKLHADHILPFAFYPELRLDVTNGRTLCVPCHKNTDTYGSRAKKHKTQTDINI